MIARSLVTLCAAGLLIFNLPRQAGSVLLVLLAASITVSFSFLGHAATPGRRLARLGSIFLVRGCDVCPPARLVPERC